MLPDHEDQRAIHGIIYLIKQNRLDDAIVEGLEALRRKYRAEASSPAALNFIYEQVFDQAGTATAHDYRSPVDSGPELQGVFNSVGWAVRRGKRSQGLSARPQQDNNVEKNDLVDRIANLPP